MKRPKKAMPVTPHTRLRELACKVVQVPKHEADAKQVAYRRKVARPKARKSS
jgi:hypothetical protein